MEYIYKKEGNRNRRYVRLSCSRCGATQDFRPKGSPGNDWVCYTCAHTVRTTCAHCGRGIVVQSSRIKSSSTGLFFCDRRCKESEQRTGGLLELPHYGSGTDYRRRALERLGSRCSVCDVSESYLLVVHHVDGNRDNSSLDNLEVLCYNHHAERHKKLVDGEYVVDYKQLWGD